MSNIKNINSTPEKSENIFSAVDNVCSQLQAIEQFMSRRFDEISMEINATSQQVDIAEEGIIKRFTEVLEVLSAISYKGNGLTPANTGEELGAVVDMTEDAANRILDAAGRINSHIHAKADWSDEKAREQVIESINNDVEEIFLACSFQDITGQRIRKTLDNLKHIEERLSIALERMGVKIDINHEPPPTAATQDDVDALFAEKREE